MQIKRQIIEKAGGVKFNTGTAQMNIKGCPVVIGWGLCVPANGCFGIGICHTILPTPVLTGSGSKGRSATPNLSARLRRAPLEMTRLCAVETPASSFEITVFRMIPARRGDIGPFEGA